MSGCSHVKAMKIDGEWFECEKCTDPGCPVHGLEAKIKALAPYYICDNPEAKEPPDTNPGHHAE